MGLGVWIALSGCTADTPATDDADSGVDERPDPVEQIAPEISFLQPEDGAQLLNGSHAVELDVSDDGAIVSVDLYVDGVLTEELDPEGPYETELYMEGGASYQLRAVAVDGDDNTSSDTIEVTVTDPGDMTCSITRPSDGGEVSSATEVRAAATSKKGEVELVEFFADGVKFGEDWAAPWSAMWEPAILEPGATVIFRILATADDGGECEARSEVTVSKEKPGDITVVVTQPSEGETVSGTGVPVWAAVESDQEVVSVELAVDGSVIDELTAPPWRFQWNSTGVANGSHELELTGTQSGGTRGSASVSVTVEN